MSGPAVPSDEELRKALAEHLMREYEQEYTVTEPVSAWYPQADRILALPEMAALIADAERVRRVRELVAFYDRHEYSSLVVDDLRAALDGTP